MCNRFVGRQTGAVLWLLAVCCAARYLQAEELKFPRIAPTPPDQAEQTFEVQHGFRMELIAAEPLLVDPVDVAYDEDGRAYVVEMRDYPFPEEKNATPTVFPGTVRLLEDTDGDGKFDRSTVFADQLAWPTSVCCWKGGVFVAAAPDIWYFRDTNGDHKADIRRKVFSGFSRYNVQAIMNSLRFGLDNHIWGAAAGNGGSVRHAERPNELLVSLARRDFRFDPVTENITAVSGGERYGATFDDWGNRFLCNIRNPVQHVVLPLSALARNPQLLVPSTIHDAADAGDQLRVFRISPPEAWREFRAQRWSLDQVNYPRSELIGAGFWTSSSGVTIYRGAAYPPEFRGNVFVGEVAGNLVHRQILTPQGVTFRSQRADADTEFVRSKDNWFRPVNFVNAPDGTLHVLDMYRETIEHPWSIPDDIKAELDLQSGNDRGRLYRLAPPDFVVPPAPKLSQATTAELVQHLNSPHGWWRETAQRLLFERQDVAAIEPLQALLRDAPFELARLQAMTTLSGLRALREDDLLVAMGDAHPGVRRWAVRLAEPRLEVSPVLRMACLKLAQDDDLRVRFEVAMALGQITDREALPALLAIARQDAADEWLRIAVLSSAMKLAEPLAVELLATPAKTDADPATETGLAKLLEQLALMTAAQGNEAGMQELLHRLVSSSPRVSPALAYATLTGLGQGLARQKQRLGDFVTEKTGVIQEAVQQLLQSTTQAAGDLAAPLPERLAAIDLLTYLSWEDSQGVLLSNLQPTQPRDVQRNALRVLGTFAEPAVADELIGRWRSLSPPLRDDAVTVLLSRPIWHEPLVTALEQGVVAPAQIAIPSRARLGLLPDKKLAERAAAVLASLKVGPRKPVLEKYQAALELKADPQRGLAVYRKSCLNCHQLDKEGFDVGPSLATIQHRSPQEILIHVLDPNREVSPNFLEYVVVLQDGRQLNGLIAAETDAGLTLRRAERQETQVLRSDIEEMVSTGKSLMPEGLEQQISLQDMADLILYLRRPVP